MAHDTDLLRALDDLAYLIECAALDCTGELKGELARLCERIAGATSGYDLPATRSELAGLEAALACYRADRKAEGTSRLIAISRRWWQVVHTGHAP